MDIGDEKEPIEFPLPTAPDEVVAEPTPPASEPVAEPVPVGG